MKGQFVFVSLDNKEVIIAEKFKGQIVSTDDISKLLPPIEFEFEVLAEVGIVKVPVHTGNEVPKGFERKIKAVTLSEFMNNPLILQAA